MTTISPIIWWRSTRTSHILLSSIKESNRISTSRESQSNKHKRNSQATRSKICYSLIEPKPLPSTTACGYEFYALAVHPHPTFTAPSVRSAFGIRSEVCGGAFFMETVNMLRPLALSQRSSIVDAWWRFHNWVYTGEPWTPPVSLILLIHTKDKYNTMKS